MNLDAAPAQPLPHTAKPERPEKLCKVFVSEDTKAALAELGASIGRGPGGAAGLIIEELGQLGLLDLVWNAHRERHRARKSSAPRLLTAGE